MLRLLADENLDMAVVRSLLRLIPRLDLVRAQAVGLGSVPDETVRAWAAQENRILLTHDRKTMPPIANGRIAAGQAMPGVIIIPWTAAVGPVIEDLLLAIGASEATDWKNKLEYLPL
ncbi:MAG: DUF5615 family PIN-like protein [Chloroflexota bacterium]|nr:DUF5615 family PIN-like protein [Chloroflexota bacterium]